MFRIYSGATEVGVADKLNYIRRAGNGCFVLCSEAEAQGIAFNGQNYTLGTNGGLENLPEVQVLYQDTATELQKTNAVTGIAFVTMAESGQVDDVTAGEHVELFSPWAEGISYKVGDMRRHGEKLYRCVQAHTSQTDWTPDVSASLWTPVADPSEQWPDWSQPVGAHDAYQMGDKVSHNGKHWTSTANANVWEPGVYGWEESTDTE